MLTLSIFVFVIVVLHISYFKISCETEWLLKNSYFEYHFKQLVNPQHSICDFFLKVEFCTLDNLLKAGKNSLILSSKSVEMHLCTLKWKKHK